MAHWPKSSLFAPPNEIYIFGYVYTSGVFKGWYTAISYSCMVLSHETCAMFHDVRSDADARYKKQQ